MGILVLPVSLSVRSCQTMTDAVTDHNVWSGCGPAHLMSDTKTRNEVFVVVSLERRKTHSCLPWYKGTHSCYTENCALNYLLRNDANMQVSNNARYGDELFMMIKQ